MPKGEGRSPPPFDLVLRWKRGKGMMGTRDKEEEEEKGTFKGYPGKNQQLTGAQKSISLARLSCLLLFPYSFKGRDANRVCIV